MASQLPDITTPPQPDGMWYIAPAKATSDSWTSKINTDQSYPKPGKDIGDGIHVSKAEGTTTRHAPVLQHPTLTLFALRSDAIVDNALLGTSALPVPALLDSTWAGAVTVTPSVVLPSISVQSK
jgi:hypothetical protein